MKNLYFCSTECLNWNQPHLVLPFSYKCGVPNSFCSNISAIQAISTVTLQILLKVGCDMTSFRSALLCHAWSMMNTLNSCNILMNLLCTLSRASISFQKYGNQNYTQYFNVAEPNFIKLLHDLPILILNEVKHAFFTTLSTCIATFWEVWTCTQRSLCKPNAEGSAIYYILFNTATSQ